MKRICFSCGKEYVGQACPHCGYSFSIKDKCPLCSMGICQATKRFCTRANGTEYLGCEIIIQQD